MVEGWKWFTERRRFVGQGAIKTLIARCRLNLLGFAELTRRLSRLA